MSSMLMAAIEKDHWLWSTRANDTELIVEGFFGLFDSLLRGDFYGLPPKLPNLQPLVRLRTICILDVRRNHHWVIGYRLSGRSPPLRGCASNSFFLVTTLHL
jgi:hypothetical protein